MKKESSKASTILKRVELFCKELRPIEDIFYLENKYNDKLITLAKKYDLLGLPVDKKYGGRELNHLDYSACLHRIGKEGTGVRTFFSGHSSLGQKTIQEFGSENQKRQYLPNSTKGKYIFALALTEPDAGSDPLSLKMKFIKKGKNFILNGTKYLISNAGIATHIIVFAHDKNKQVSAFIIDTNTKGITKEDMKAKLGMHTTNTAMFELKNFVVPDSDLIGNLGDGWNMAKHALLNGRLSVAAGCLGVIWDCLEDSVSYSKSRIQHKKPIAKHQLIQEHLAQIKVKLDASTLLVQAAAKLKDLYHKKKVAFIAVDTMIAEAKFFAANASCDAADRAVQIYGGRGYSQLYRPARHFADTRVCRIYEGTDEIMKLKIAESILGKEFSAFR